MVEPFAAKAFSIAPNTISDVVKTDYGYHIIKVTDSTKFRIRVKNEKEIKKALCMKCKKSSLFSREDQNFIRCLNCGNVICKYCFKQLGEKNENSIRKLNTIYAICYNHIKTPFKRSKSKKGRISATMEILPLNNQFID